MPFRYHRVSLHETGPDCPFRGRNNSAQALLSRGLSREDKRMIKKLVSQAQGVNDIKTALQKARSEDSCNVTIDERHRQIQEFFTRVGGCTGSHDSGAKLDQLLAGLRAGTQAKIKERECVYGVDQVPRRRRIPWGHLLL